MNDRKNGSDGPDVETADYPSVTFTWTPQGLAYEMHAMSGPLLHMVAGVAQHEAEKLLFQNDVEQMQRDRGGIVDLSGRKAK